MQKALIALDSLEGGPGSWTFGGGTALARILGHRISYDVDIFLDSSTVLKNLAPNINPVTKSLCDTWQWPGKYLKLILRDVYLYDRSALGEIAQCPAITDHVVLSALNRLNLAKHQYQSEMRKLINSTPRGEEFIDKSCEIALEALAEIRTLIPKNETEPGNGMSR
jgi:hypothetical protein